MVHFTFSQVPLERLDFRLKGGRSVLLLLQLFTRTERMVVDYYYKDLETSNRVYRNVSVFLQEMVKD